jgi:hypothetical protein
MYCLNLKYEHEEDLNLVQLIFKPKFLTMHQNDSIGTSEVVKKKQIYLTSVVLEYNFSENCQNANVNCIRENALYQESR